MILQMQSYICGSSCLLLHDIPLRWAAQITQFQGCATLGTESNGGRLTKSSERPYTM